MPIGPVQRYPNGLLQLLDLKAVTPPATLADSVSGVIDLMQFYARSQYQRRTAVDGALAKAGTLLLTVPNDEYWLLLHADFNVAKSATMTELATAVILGPSSGQTVPLQAEEFQRFGANSTGSARCCLTPPQPIILLPGWVIGGRIDQLGTDATASTAFSAGVGIFK